MRERIGSLVFLGGAIGSMLRAVLGELSDYNLAILLINIAGAALLGFVHAAALFRSESRQAFWGTGFCGGFTTLSAIDLMLQKDFSGYTVSYAVGSLVLGVAAYAVAKSLSGKRGSTESSAS